MIVLEELNDTHAAYDVADKIIRAFKDGEQVLGNTIKVSISMGVVTFGNDSEETLQTLMKKADIALYQAKVAGKNQFKVYPK